MNTVLTFNPENGQPVLFDGDTHLPLARVAESVARQLKISPLNLELEAYTDEEGCIKVFVDDLNKPCDRFFVIKVDLPTKTIDGQLRPQEVVLEDSPCKKMPKLISLVAFTVAYYLQEQAK